MYWAILGWCWGDPEPYWESLRVNWAVLGKLGGRVLCWGGLLVLTGAC